MTENINFTKRHWIMEKQQELHHWTAFLLMTVVKSDYLSYYRVPCSSDQSMMWILTEALGLYLHVCFVFCITLLPHNLLMRWLHECTAVHNNLHNKVDGNFILLELCSAVITYFCFLELNHSDIWEVSFLQTVTHCIYSCLNLKRMADITKYVCFKTHRPSPLKFLYKNRFVV